MSGSLKPARPKQEEGSLMNLFNWSCPMLMTMHSSFLTVRRVVGDESVLDGVHVHAHHGGIGELGAQLAAEAAQLSHPEISNFRM
jgi:hypothetical protein